MSHHKKKTCLILDWRKLPKKLMDEIREYESFHNDCYLNFHSEFEPKKLDMQAIEDYWNDQKACNSYKGTLEEFINEYHLELEIWLIEQKLDLSDVDIILIEVCW